MKQKQENFRLRAKTALIKREMTITELAKRISKSRVATSQAINRGENPKVKKLIAKELKIA